MKRGHKRTHLGPGPRTSRRERDLELKPITAQPPPRGRKFAARVERVDGYSSMETAPGCSRTYTPPDEE